MTTQILSAPRFRRWALLLGSLLGTAAAHGQNVGYATSNASTNAGTYTDLGTNGTAISTANTDDANSTAQNIGFTFTFNGTAFTQFVLNTNGLLRLGANAPSSAAACSPYGQAPDAGPINSTNAADVNLLLPFNFDLTAGTSTPEYRVATTGTAPNRVCTVQWKNVSDKAVATSSSDATLLPTQYTNLSFQVKLYEGTNLVEYVYAAPTVGATSALKYAVVGLKGSGNASGQTVLASKASSSAWSTTTFVTGPQLDIFTANANNFRSTFPPDAGRTYRFSSAAVIAPANNDCAGAVTLTPAATCTATTGTTVGASQSLAPIVCGIYTGNSDDDVWYKFVATATSHTITVVGSATFDAVVDVRSGTCASSTNIGCADATGAGSTEATTVTGLTVGSTYYVRVYSYDTTQGTFTVCVTGGSGGGTTCAGVTNAAVTNTGSTATAASANISFTAAAGATNYTVTVTPTSGSGTPLTGTVTTSPVSVSSLALNTPYTVSIVTNCANGGTSSPVTVTFTSAAASPLPANDDCAGAITLTPSPTCTPTNGTTAGASQSLAAIACGGYTGNADDDVWYKFVATATSHTVTVVGAGAFDAVIDVRSGTCASSTNIGCADATVAGGTETATLSGLTVGSTYFVRVYTYDNAAGTFTICVTGPAPVCSAPTALAAGSITTTGATLTFTAPASGATGYTVTYTAAGGTAQTQAATGSPVVLTGLTPATAYTVSIVTNCGAGQTSAAATTTFTTLSPCNAPTALTAGSITTTGATLTFTAPAAGATGYTVTYTAAGGTAQTQTATGSPVVLTGLTSGVAYTVSVVTNCGAGQTSAAATTTFTTLSPCSAPTALTAGSITTTGATLTFTAPASGATGYTVTYTAAGGTAQTQTATGSPVVLTGLTSGVAYTVSVVTNCGGGQTSAATTTTFTTLSPCTAVTSLATSNVTTNSATLSFTGASAGTSYTVTYTAAGGTAQTQTATGSPVTLANLTPATVYTVSVVTNCGSSQVSPSASTTFTTLTPCSAPTALTAGSITTTGATLTFTAPASGATGYTVTYTAAGGTAQTQTATGSPVVLTGLTSGVAYTVSVVTNCGGGQTSAATTTTFTTLTPCTAVTTLTAGSITANGATLAFTGASAGTSYTVTYTAAGGTAQTQTATGSPVVLTGLLSGKQYSVSIVTNCGTGQTSPAATTTFTTLAPAPTNATASNVTATGASINFTAATGATNYTVTYTAAGGSPVTVTATSSPVVLTGLTGITTYTVTIVANYPGGGVSTPTTVTFTTPQGLSVRAKIAGGEMAVYPNPAHQAFTISLPAISTARTAQLELVNTMGQTMSRQTISLTAGGTRIPVDATGLATGVYSVQVRVGGETAITRLVIE